MNSPAPTPDVRLVSRVRELPTRSWPGELPSAGVWRVTGPAGSGVSSLLVDTVLARIDAGLDPTGILVVASSKETGALLRRELTSLQLKGILAAVPLDDLLDYSQYFDMVDLSLGDDVIYFVNPFIATDGNFITLDTFAAFHQPIVQILGTCTAERPKGLDTILFLLSRLTHSRRKYLIRHHCSFESEQSRSSIKVVKPYQCRCIHRHKDGDKGDS